MKVQWGKLAWIALAIVLVAAGCGSSTTQPAPTAVPPTQPPAPTATTALAFPTGTFAKGSWTWEFRADGTYSTRERTTEYEADGVYTVAGNQIVLQDDSFTCKDAVATYVWAYDGEALSFTVVDDRCGDRRDVIDRSKWVKKP